MPSLFQEFSALLRALTDARIPFAVCGGVAMAVHARPRATVDIDLLAPVQAVPRLVDAARGLGFDRKLRDPRRLAGGVVVMHRLVKIIAEDPDVLMLDVIEVGPGPTEAAWQSRVTASWEGMTVSMVLRAGLVGLKRLRGSAQDLVDIRALEEGA